MNNVLILTYYWPPAGGPGVQRWLYFSRYLPEFGWRPVLFIPERPHYPLQDPGLVELIPEGLPTYTCRFWEPYGLASLLGRKKTKRMSSGIIKRERPGFLERLLLWVRGNLFIPDARRGWIPRAVSELPAILEKEHIHTVVTTGPPHSVHLIGLKLKRRLGIRWVADFRDPWTGIGYHDMLRLGPRARRLHQKMEQEVLRTADRVVATSTLTARDLEAISGRPVAVITNGYDVQTGDGVQPEGDFVLAHIGSLLSGRNPLALWKALAKLREEDSEFREAFRLELTGLVSPEVEDALRQSGIWQVTEVRGYVSHAAALALQTKAQLLLLIEIDSPETRGIVPGKLFEYMAAARPVLAVGPEGWEATERLETAGCGKGFTYSEQDAIAAQIREWFALYKKGSLSQDTKATEGYSRKAVTKQLSELLWES